MILRDVRDEDLDTFFEHWTDPESNRVAAFTAESPNDREAFDARWSRLRANDEVTSRTVEVDGVVIGVISELDTGRRPRGHVLAGPRALGQGPRDARARGILEVETTRPLHAAAAADNVGSIRVLEKCGFERVGEEEASRGRGEEIDEVLLVLR